MAKRPTLTDIAAAFASASMLNDNFNAILEAFDNTVSRDGSTPNEMLADLDMNGFDILNVGNIESTANSVSRAVVTEYVAEDRANVASKSIDSTVNAIWVAGYAEHGDGGHALYVRVGAEPSHAFKVQSADGAWWELVVFDSGLNPKQVGAKGDNSTDDATALGNWLGDSSLSRKLYLPESTYLIGSGLSVSDGPLRIAGAGWGWNAAGTTIGTVLKASSTSVADLLTIQSSTPGSGASTDIRGFEIADLALVHRGSGTGLKIDNVVYPRVVNVDIDCNQEGAIGLELDNWSFFAVLEKSRIRNATNRCVLIDGEGTQHMIRDCHIASDQTSDAPAALEIRRFDFLVDGGQYQSNRATDDGIGILVNNTSGSAAAHNGRIVNTLCENDVAVKITGDTFPFTDIIIERPTWSMTQMAKGVIFDRATRCLLIEPSVDNPGGSGVLAEWTANSTDCGIICGREGARAGVTVDASATRAWKRVIGNIEYSDRANFTTDANLTTIIDHVNELAGTTIHNGIAWDKYYVSIDDDDSTTVTAPDVAGTVRVFARGSLGGHVEMKYVTESTSGEALIASSAGAVTTSSGTLNGTTGVDGDLTLRFDHSTGLLHIENRLGATLNFIVIFDYLNI